MFTTIVSTATAAAHLKDENCRFVDCRFDLRNPDAGRLAYESGHLPGAVFADLEEDLSAAVTPSTGRHPLPDPAALAHRLGEWGIHADTQVVVYDDLNGAFAARLWWLLRWLGHPAVAVLDGGLGAWTREARLLRTGEEPHISCSFERRPSLTHLVSADDVLERLNSPDFLLLDARAPERYRGDVEPIDPVAGHVPGALNRPTSANLASDGCFLPAEVLRDHYVRLLAGRRTENVAVMCGSGVTACHDLLALELAGLHGACLYAGSWSEWIRDPARPVARGDQP